MENSIRTTIKVSNGVNIPAVGLGVWRVKDEDELRGAVKAAFDNGYWHIDTASVYGNEDTVGRAVSEYADRKDIFITTKLWNEDQLNVESAFETSLKNLKTDYIDQYLIHWPSPKKNNYTAAWKAFKNSMDNIILGEVKQ